MRKLLVTGCGRSATGYIAQVLTRAGIQCGHEEVFNPKADQYPDCTNVIAESSWLAIPWLSYVESLGFLIVHQVRHPIEVLRSCMGIGLFHCTVPQIKDNPYRRCIVDYDKFIFSWDDPLRRAMAWWLRWNEAAEAHSALTYCVENVDVALLKRFGIRATQDVLQEALTFDKKYNHRQRDETISWDSLPQDPLTRLLKQTASRYGYDVP